MLQMQTSHTDTSQKCELTEIQTVMSVVFTTCQTMQF